MSVAIDVKGLSKKYILRHNRSPSLRNRIIGIVNRDLRERREEFWVLRDIDLRIEAGTTVGLVGRNGSGKSTLLKIIAQTIQPTQGTVWTSGRVAPMIELGLGFNPELNGRENLYLNASLYGFSRRETDAVYDDVVKFSGLDTFIDVPIKNYSSGMYMRLAFATAVHMNPEILLVDEVLAVGDDAFQKKCLERMKQLQEEGKTIVFVSHNANLVRRVCTSAVWLDQGRIKRSGPVDEVIADYERPEVPPAPV